ncbi:hypothetical protein IJ182_05410 [bacterium]|nr:hypothetical protein [bacterium]
MFNINKTGVNIPIKTRYQAHKTEKRFQKSGYSNVVKSVNNNGDIAILGYKGIPDKDELVAASVINPDGKETLKLYKTVMLDSKEARYPRYSRIIETWDVVKNNLIFKKHTTMQYNGYSAVPEVISTMYNDDNDCDGVKIVRKYPYREYSKCFQKPEKDN